MFRHYRVIVMELVINTLPSYTSISNAAVGNTIYNQDVLFGLLFPLDLMLLYFGVRCLDLHVLLYQMATFLFSKFSLVFL